MVGVGGIVSVGGGAGGPGGGSTSGITSINSETGPSIVINGANGIDVLTASNVITIDGSSLSGLIGSGGGAQSGVIGVNGIDVQQVDGNLVVDGASISGLIEPSGGVGGINGQIGPHIELQGVNGATVTVVGENELIVDVSALSGIIPDPDGSGINAINGDTGPNIDLIGVNGIEVTPLGNGDILINGAGASGTSGGGGSATQGCFSSTFSNITSGIFDHSLGTRSLLVEIQDDSAPPRLIYPDDIVYDTLDRVSLLFNTPQSGRVTIIACSGTPVLSESNLCEAKRYALLVG